MSERKAIADTDPLSAGKQSISRDLILGFALVALAISLLIVLLNYFYLSAQSKRTNAKKAIEFVDYLQGSLELPLWNIDLEGVRKIGATLMRNERIAMLRITDDTGQSIFEMASSDKTDLQVATGTVIRRNVTLGTIEIGLTSRLDKENNRRLLASSFITMVIVILALVILTKLMLSLFLIKPLDHLIDRIEGIARGEYEFGHHNIRQQEIGVILSKFDRMAAQVKHRESRLTELNTRLAREIEDHTVARDALYESEERFRSLVSNIPGGIYRVKSDTNRTMIYISSAFAEICGYPAEEFIAPNPRGFAEIIHPGDRQRVSTTIDACLAARRSFSMEYRILHADGNIRWVFEKGRGIWDKEGELICIDGAIMDVSERKRAEEELVRSEEEMNSIIRNTPDIIYRLDFDGRLTFISEAVSRYGYPPDKLLGTYLLDYVHAADRERARYHINERRTGERSTKRLEIRLFDPQAVPFNGPPSTDRHTGPRQPVFVIDAEGLYAGTPHTRENFIGTQGIARDITAQKELENRLRQSQKMEAIGTLAGGIAHDFNNILGAIFGYTQLAQMNASEGDKVEKYLGQILLASRRARDLVQQILTFSRQSKSQKKPCRFGHILQEVLKLMRASLPTTIEIRTSIGTDQDGIMADQIQIHQMLMNLCTNAFHAMEDNGGTLDVSLNHFTLRSDEVKGHGQISPGDYLQIIFKDTGCGMPPEVTSRIFDPYFTTKKVGKGTGMGMATVHGIVREHGGTIRVESQLGRGSEFTILLPLWEGGHPVKPNDSLILVGGGERILFVDDEPILVDVGREMLQSLGYQVRGATDPKDALERFLADPHGFDLIITDMTMPGMTGAVLAEQVFKVRPQMPVILCTGFSKVMTDEKVEEMGIKALMMKPLVTEELAVTIRNVLDGVR